MSKTLEEALKDPAVGPRPISIEEYKAKTGKATVKKDLTAIPAIRLPKRRGGKRNKQLRRRAHIKSEIGRTKDLEYQRRLFKELFVIEKELDTRKKTNLKRC